MPKQDIRAADFTPCEEPKTDRFLLGASVAALILRLLVVIAIWHAKPAAWFYTQASELGEVAQSINLGHGIASPFGGNTGPSAFLPPGYPLFVAGLFHFWGAYSHAAELILLLCQACFGATAVLLMALAARATLSHTTARVTALVLAFHPWLIALCFVFWETSFSLMTMAALLWICTVWLRQPSRKVAWAAALLGFIAISTNASLALTCLGLFAWTVYKQKRQRRYAIIPCLVLLLLCSVWPIRNAVTMHAFIPLRDNLGYELWQGNRIGANGFFDPDLHPNTSLLEYHQFRQLGELSYMRAKSDVVKQAIAAAPLRFARLTAKRIVCFWLGIGRQIFWNQIAIASVTSILGFAGCLMLLCRRPAKMVALFAIPLALFPLPYYVTHPDFRFWCLLAPVLTTLAVSLFVPGEQSAETKVVANARAEA